MILKMGLKWKFIMFFSGLGIIISLGIGLTIYHEYNSYIKYSYTSTLRQVLELVDKQCLLVHEDTFMDEVRARSDKYWDAIRNLHNIAETFNMVYIYFAVKEGGSYRMSLLSAYDQSDENNWPYDDPPETLNKVYATGTPKITPKPYTDEMGTYITAYLPVVKGSKVIGVWGADYPYEYTAAEEKQAWVILITALLLSVILAGALALILALSLTRPIIKVVEKLKEISDGEGDLTRTININSKDEVGDLAMYFNKTLSKIRALILNVRKEALALLEIGNALASNMTETAAAINEITANIRSIKGRIISQSASVSETNATMEQVVTNINKLNSHVENQSAKVSGASSALEEMVANINAVTQTLVNNSVNVKTLRDASESGRGGLQEVAADIQGISRESEGLMEINAVIENIASQTNLLSMNAAIEAAHAGDTGKGFAVVAGEIRKLAESSSLQSKTISAVLKKIKNSIDKISKSTENVLIRFQAIDSSVKIVAEQENNIRGAMVEQGEGSRQVLEGVSEVNEITRQVRGGSQEMLAGAKEVIQESHNLEKATQEITGGINEMASGAEQINAAVNNVNDISNKNREGINLLIKEVSRFKVE
jgi:methyl-accepting chemotaxis protein